MKVHTGWKYCHNRKCQRIDCLRHEKNMELNTLSLRGEFLCNEENGYREALFTKPEKDELTYQDLGHTPDDYEGEEISKKVLTPINESTQGYIDFLNDIIKHSRVRFYIEPFVGKSNSILKIEGVSNKFGTDISEENLRNKMNECNGSDKEFQVKDYRVWDRVILSDDYKGKCIVFCEPPRKDSETFNQEEFLEKMREWGAKNKVYVRCGKLKRRRPLYTIGDDDFIYQLY